MMSVAIHGAAPESGPPGAVEPVTLRVSGAKPVRLRGHKLTEGHSRAAGCIAWHEVEIWQLENSREIAVALRTRRPGGEAADLHRAELFPDLAEALDWLEGFDPVADLTVDFDAGDRRLSAVEVALRAAALRGRAEVVTREWRALLGEVLFVLDAEAPA
ncbi:hypothetical protein G3576_06100 [Roseomonas stagni]|uniref:Uncharacterized protein n=1 Tax=Falsiroseomonas algicola TaxID=2716930 RepID=A0A6M1LHC3_9PROT|nr:hypothetical protein [Falsiroseomonas algicola]NGM19577.1 hypothetical protein [Falsiroseomonas algicola]